MNILVFIWNKSDYFVWRTHRRTDRQNHRQTHTCRSQKQYPPAGCNLERVSVITACCATSAFDHNTAVTTSDESATVIICGRQWHTSSVGLNTCGMTQESNKRRSSFFSYALSRRTTSDNLHQNRLIRFSTPIPPYSCFRRVCVRRECVCQQIKKWFCRRVLWVWTKMWVRVFWQAFDMFVGSAESANLGSTIALRLLKMQT